MNDWIKFLKNYYKEKKEKDSSYSYKDAMKDARNEYKKGGADKKRKTEKRKTRKNKLRKSSKNRK